MHSINSALERQELNKTFKWIQTMHLSKEQNPMKTLKVYSPSPMWNSVIAILNLSINEQGTWTQGFADGIVTAKKEQFSETVSNLLQRTFDITEKRCFSPSPKNQNA